MPTITTVPRIRRPAAPDPEAIHNGTQPRMNAKDVIRMGRRRRRAPSSAASTRSRPFSNSVFANSTIRIAFFAASPIEHDQTDLRVHVQVVAAQPEAGEGAEDRDRHRQQHRERQRPALIERRQNQEHEHQRQRRTTSSRPPTLASPGMRDPPSRSPSRAAGPLCATSSSAAIAWPEL